jgi:predicted aspartyl protease
MALSILRGSIDQQRRAILRLEQANGDDGFAAQVDTGFNGYLMVHEADLAKLAFKRTNGSAEVQVARGMGITVFFAEATVIWFDGKLRRINVFVVPDPPPRRLPDDPIVLLGTKLIDPHRLTIDFTLNILEITRAD